MVVVGGVPSFDTFSVPFLSILGSPKTAEESYSPAHLQLIAPSSSPPPFFSFLSCGFKAE